MYFLKRFAHIMVKLSLKDYLLDVFNISESFFFLAVEALKIAVINCQTSFKDMLRNQEHAMHFGNGRP